MIKLNDMNHLTYIGIICKEFGGVKSDELYKKLVKLVAMVNRELSKENDTKKETVKNEDQNNNRFVGYKISLPTYMKVIPPQDAFKNILNLSKPNYQKCEMIVALCEVHPESKFKLNDLDFDSSLIIEFINFIENPKYKIDIDEFGTFFGYSELESRIKD